MHPLGPMHACLNVDEIVRLIAGELVESKAKATAAALACCCKNFEGPVSDTLWETQEELLPLLKSLPVDVWNEGGYTVSTPKTRVFPPLNCFIRRSFKKRPTTLEWARFRKYARKIRKLREPEEIARVLSLEVFSILQLCAISDPFFPNLKTLELWSVDGKSIPLIPLFLSPRTAIIKIRFSRSDSPAAVVAPMVAAFPILCPNLQEIVFNFTPRDPIVVTAVSRMLLANNRNTLQSVHVDSPLTAEAREVISKLPNLRELSVTIERDIPFPSMVLPNLIRLIVKYDRDRDWLSMFCGATFGKLEAVTFRPESGQIGNFLEAFEVVALAASFQNTLSEFYLYTLYSWNPNYTSLLPFTQLTDITIGSRCNDGCSSRVDDDVIVNIARAMPKLKILRLGDSPCREIPIGVTVEGLVALTNLCPDLYSLRIHFQVASLSALPAIHEPIPNVGPIVLRRDYALENFVVGEIPIPEESVPMVAQTLARIFPRLEFIDYIDQDWEKVMNTIRLSREIID